MFQRCQIDYKSSKFAFILVNFIGLKRRQVFAEILNFFRNVNFKYSLICVNLFKNNLNYLNIIAFKISTLLFIRLGFILIKTLSSFKNFQIFLYLTKNVFKIYLES